MSPVSRKYEYTSLESQHCICSPDGNRIRSSLSVSGSVTLRKVCAWKTSSASGLMESLSLSTATMMWSAVTLPACVYAV